jgi:lactoylglutathione lyase
MKELETMKFLWVTLSVLNMEESLKFYQEIVGLPVTRRFSSENSGDIAFLGDGDTKLELIAHPKGNEPHYGKEMSIGFEVDSVDQKIQFIRGKGLSIESGPFEPTPHVRFFFVKDPSGIRVQFVENR